MSNKTEREKLKRREEKELEKARFNKIYRAPPTPPPEKQHIKEKGFVLDCKAMNSITRDYAQCNPKLGPTIPPYNSQKDKMVDNYYTYDGVDTTLKKTEQVRVILELCHAGVMSQLELCPYLSYVRSGAMYVLEFCPYLSDLYTRVMSTMEETP